MNKMPVDELRKEIVKALNNQNWVATMNREQVVAFLESRGWTLADVKKYTEDGA